MKKILLGLILSGMLVSASNAGVKDAFNGSVTVLKNNKGKAALVAGGVAATAVIIYDLSKGEKSTLKKLAKKSPELAAKVKEFIKNHPYITGTTAGTVVLAVVLTADVKRGEEKSLTLKGLNQVENAASSLKDTLKNNAKNVKNRFFSKKAKDVQAVELPTIVSTQEKTTEVIPTQEEPAKETNNVQNVQ